MPGAEHKLTTPKSASHLFNNVAANGKHVGYVAYTSAIIVRIVCSSHLETGNSGGYNYAVTPWAYALPRCLSCA